MQTQNQIRKYKGHHYAKGTIEQRLRLRFLRARCQARYRAEPWEITWEEYQNIWNHRPPGPLGRSSRASNMCRVDTDLPWSVNNVQWLPRGEGRRKVHK